jgi:hypothetical protein
MELILRFSSSYCSSLSSQHFPVFLSTHSLSGGFPRLSWVHPAELLDATTALFIIHSRCCIHCVLWATEGFIKQTTNQNWQNYSRIISKNSPQFCTPTFSASLTNLMVLSTQPNDCSCYVSKPILAPPPLWLQKHTDLRTRDFGHSPDLWHQPKIANVTCAWSWRLFGIAPAITASKWRQNSPLALPWFKIHPSPII